MDAKNNGDDYLFKLESEIQRLRTEIATNNVGRNDDAREDASRVNCPLRKQDCHRSRARLRRWWTVPMKSSLDIARNG
jgi:hypothetical protein